MQQRYRVAKRKREEWADSDTPVYRVTLILAHDPAGGDQWWRRQGEISIVTTNPDEAERFKPGAQFVVEFTPANDGGKTA